MDTTGKSHTDSLKFDKKSIPWSLMTPEKDFDRNGGAENSLKEVGKKPDPLLADSSTNIGESCKMLETLFHSLVDSIPIPLCLQGSAAHGSPKVVFLSGREFTYNQLAQIKFILPEEMGIEKILVRDVRTSCCMKPVIVLTIDGKAFEDNENAQFQSVHILLTKIYHSCLVAYLKDHPPRDDEIPEEDLSKTFNALKLANQTYTTPPIQQSSASIETPQKKPVVGHISQALIRGFSQIAITKATELQDIVAAPAYGGRGPSCSEMIPKTQCSLTETAIPTPTSPKELIAFATTLGKHTNCAPEKSASAMPRLTPLKRSYTTSSDMISTNNSFATPVQSHRATEKSVSVTPSDTVGVTKSGSELDSRLQPRRCCKSIKIDRKDLENGNPEEVLRKHMIAGLPILIDIVYAYQSRKRLVFRKKELVHTLMTCNFDIFDRAEAEKHIELLLQHAPDWIYEEKREPEDSLLCIKKIIGDHVSKCTRLMEAYSSPKLVEQGS